MPAAMLALTGCSGRQPEGLPRQGGSEPAPVTVAEARLRDVPVRLSAFGHVTPFSTVAVQSRVDGVLERVHFQQGEIVKEGSLIFTIDPRPFQAALDQAKATLKKDKATAKYAELEACRNAELFNQGILPQDANDQSRANADAQRAAVVADEAVVTNAQLQLSFCYIRAPITGRAGTLRVNAGNVVKNLDTVLVTINQTQPIYVDFSVPEQELARIRAHLAAVGSLEVTAQPGGGEPDPVTGELTIINNTVDTSTGTILLRAIFRNQDERLWPGQFVNAVLTLTTVTNAVVVPSAAVQIGQQGPYVFVAKPGLTAEARPVASGGTWNSQTVLLRGVEAGEKVVITGQVRLAPGSKVRIVNPVSAGAGLDGHSAGTPGA